MMKSKIPIRKRFVPNGITLLYEDRDILVIDKSAGLLSVKARYESELTAHNLLTQYIRKGNSRATAELFVVHRLDRETSGLLMFAKSLAIRETLASQWTRVEKKYLALVHGTMNPKNGLIESYLADDEDYVVRTVQDPQEGKLARTRYQVIRESNNQSLLEIDLLTGKKNQIRVHLSEKGHPIVGDAKYGAQGNSKGRLCLHAWKLKFQHPFTHEALNFEAVIPPCFNV